MGCTCTSVLLLSSSSLFTCQPRLSSRHRTLKLRIEAQNLTFKTKFNGLQLSPIVGVLKSRHALPSLVIGHTLDSGNYGSNNNNNNNNKGGGRNNDNDGDNDNDNDNHRKSQHGWASSRKLLLCLYLALGSFSIFHLISSNAFGIGLDKEQESRSEEVWEIKGSKWTKLIPHPFEDEFEVVPSSSLTPSSSSLVKGEGRVGNPNLSVNFHGLWLICKDIVISLMLPEGFPNSVTSDYLDYSLWRGVQGIASQISGVLATQSLLYAVGLGKGAIPTAAAINWVLKDGIGYLSKIVLSKYGRHFDVHPKGWRLFADLLENAAFGLEILTPAVPHLFVFIGTAAGAGRSAAALIQAATRSCFYAGFAAKRNFAEVIAKGEAQGMVSKSIGIMMGIALANAIGSSTPLSIACFSLITCVHMFCNLKSYQSIQLRTLNPYRASLVYSEYLLSGQIPSVKEVNDEEPLFPLIPLLNLRPPHAADSSILSAEAKNAAEEIERRMELGSTLSNLIQRKEDAIALFDLYKDERYILAECNGKFCVVLKEGASPNDMLRSLYHVNFLYWLETNAGIRSKCASDDCKPGGKLQLSLEYVQREFDHVKQDSELAGWVSDGLIARPLPHRIRIENVSNTFQN